MGSPKVIGPTERFKEIASKMKVNTAILAITHDRPSGLIGRILEARLNGMTIMEMPTVYETLTRRVPVEHIYDQWLLFTDGFYLVSKEYMQKVKRLVDFVISALLLLGTLPITALSALAIRFDSAGPVFFKQEFSGTSLTSLTYSLLGRYTTLLPFVNSLSLPLCSGISEMVSSRDCARRG